MEVVACFLQKYFSLLADNKVQELKAYYSNNAIVSVAINGEAETATGSALVEKVAEVFANGVITIEDVKLASTISAIVLTATGVVNANEVESTFTQQVTLFVEAKHWYIAAEQVDITVPEAVEEEQEEAEEEQQVEEAKVEEVAIPAPKNPTPQRSPAIKPKEAPVVKPKEAPVVKAEPVQAAAPAQPKEAAPAPKGWAALAAAAPSAEKPKVKTVVNIATPTAPVKAAAPAPAQIQQGIHFTLNVPAGSQLDSVKENNANLKALVQAQVIAEFPKSGVPVNTIIGVRTHYKDINNKVNVFVDLSIPDALEKLNQNLPTMFGVRIPSVKLQNPK